MPTPAFLQLEHALNEVVLGNARASRLLLVALLARGHVLIEGPPGVGKTSLAHTLASRLGADFRRVQFTPDLLPADLLGYKLYHQHSGDFEFIRGPVFAHILLADEINRTSPRVQSALLESMNEGQVSIDGTTHDLPFPHFVVATQNDTFSTGTFPLPEPQLDRFLLSIRMDLPTAQIQHQVLMQHGKPEKSTSSQALLDIDQIIQLQQKASAIPVSEAIAKYIIDLCENLRISHGDPHSVSIRASLSILAAARAQALIEGHPAVHPEDVRFVLAPTLRHRIAPGDNDQATTWLEQALQSTPVP